MGNVLQLSYIAIRNSVYRIGRNHRVGIPFVGVVYLAVVVVYLAVVVVSCTKINTWHNPYVLLDYRGRLWGFHSLLPATGQLGPHAP